MSDISMSVLNTRKFMPKMPSRVRLLPFAESVAVMSATNTGAIRYFIGSPSIVGTDSDSRLNPLTVTVPPRPPTGA